MNENNTTAMGNLYKKISRMKGPESYDEKLYKLLNTEKYRTGQYDAWECGEDMEVIDSLIWFYWKPRFVLDHRAKRAFEFISGTCKLLTVTQEDIDWESVMRMKGIVDEDIAIAWNLDFRYPSRIYRYKNGVAEVRWQLHPDGRYYMDDDGFGMTNDQELNIYGYIDREGRVVVPFQDIEGKDTHQLRRQAEEAVRQREEADRGASAEEVTTI